ncbi:MAG TPA: ArsC/Spx/MgsR family protein [Beutenbergiaceae bacterium]|nr:ArsC/Spx/MgsR family protein [Beutenbergiaceae bacterium]
MAKVTIFHNPRCSTSRHALEQAETRDVEAEVVQYLKEPLGRDQVLALMEILQDPPGDLVRKDAYFKELGLTEEDYTTPEQVADLLGEHPRLMQRPVLVRGDRAIIGRPKDRLGEFLSN